MHPLLDELRLLADDPGGDLARVDHALQRGCARKLGLETVRLRLQRRLMDAAARGRPSGELLRLSVLLARADDDVSRLAALIRAVRARRTVLLAG